VLCLLVAVRVSFDFVWSVLIVPCFWGWGRRREGGGGGGVKVSVEIGETTMYTINVCTIGFQ